MVKLACSITINSERIWKRWPWPASFFFKIHFLLLVSKTSPEKDLVVCLYEVIFPVTRACWYCFHYYLVSSSLWPSSTWQYWENIILCVHTLRISLLLMFFIILCSHYWLIDTFCYENATSTNQESFGKKDWPGIKKRSDCLGSNTFHSLNVLTS